MSKKTSFISRVAISILLLPGLNSVASSQTGNSILGFNLTRKDQNRLSQFEKVVEQVPTRDSLKETLVSLEKQSWEAWKNRDARFFQSFLSDDHVEVGFGGPTNKAVVVNVVGSPACVVKSYSVDRFELTMFDANAALLTYHAAQDTTCGGNAVPSPVWASSLYIKRGDKWFNAAYQQTATNK